MVGPRHAGKTVFLAALANCPAITSGDPSTIKLLKSHWNALREGKNPQATGGTYTELEFAYRGETNGQFYDLEFTMPDYDGHFAEIMSDYESGEKGLDELRSAFEAADGFVIFMPYDRDDIKIMEAARFEIGHFIRIVRLFREGKGKIDVPLAIIVNKWDKSPDFKTPDEDAAAARFVESQGAYRALSRTLENFFANIFVIPVSAYGKPVEGQAPPEELVPYRVTEPIERLLDANYKNFREKLEKYRDENNWRLVIETLVAYRELWARTNDAENLESLFALTIDSYARDLIPRLEAAKDDAEWNRIFKEAGGEVISEYLTESGRKAVGETRSRTLGAAFDALMAKLDPTKNLEEFETVLREAPESASEAYFNTGQKRRLEESRQKHLGAAKKKKIFVWVKIVCAALVLGGLVGVIIWSGGVEKRYLYAIGERGSVSESFRNLRDFLDYGADSPLAARFFSVRFDDARERLEKLGREIGASRERELAEISTVADPIEREKRATEFLERLNSGDIPTPENLLAQARSLLERSTRSSELVASIESAQDLEGLEAIRPKIAAMPKGAEASDLESRFDARVATLKEKKREAALEAEAARNAEASRLASEEAVRLLERGSYAEAVAFIASKGSDAPEGARLKNALPSVYARNMAELIADGPLDDLDYLLEQKEIAGKLDENEINKLGAALKKRLATLENSLIDEFDAPIGSLAQLEDMEKTLDAFRETRERARYSAFAAAVGSDSKLENLMNKSRLYREILDKGLEVASLNVLASAPNALNLSGRKWTNAFRKNDDLAIKFPNGASLNSDVSGFVAEEKGGEFILRFGPYKLERQSGRIELIAENGGEKFSCAWTLHVGPSELFGLYNRGSLLIPAGGTCAGISLEFKK